MALANVSNQILRSDGGSATVAVNSPLTGNGSQQLPLGLDENYHGADGESLTFNITDIANGHQVTISGSQGSSSFNVLNGQDGANGVNGVNGADGQSVTFDITNIANGHSVTLSGAQGSTSFDVMNGQNGVDGISPTFRFVENEDRVIVFVSGAQGEESFTLYDGETHIYSAGPNIDITNDVISGRDWSNEIDAKLDTTAFSLPNSGNWDNTYNTVNANSAQWSNDTTYSAGPNIDITNNLISGKDWTDTITAASAYAASLAQSGSDFVMIDSTTSYSAIGLYEQYYDPGCYQIMGTAYDGSAPGKSFGYTLPTQSRLFSADCVDSAKNYTNSAISAHIMYVNYEALVSGDVTFANIRTCINNGGIVIPYEINLQSNNYKIYNYELSGVNNDTTGYTFGRFEASGKHQYMVISSYNNGATTGCITANEKLYATPNDVALVDRIVIVATSGDIPSSGKSDNKLYIVSGTK